MKTFLIILIVDIFYVVYVGINTNWYSKELDLIVENSDTLFRCIVMSSLILLIVLSIRVIKNHSEICDSIKIRKYKCRLHFTTIIKIKLFPNLISRFALCILAFFCLLSSLIATEIHVLLSFPTILIIIIFGFFPIVIRSLIIVLFGTLGASFSKYTYCRNCKIGSMDSVYYVKSSYKKEEVLKTDYKFSNTDGETLDVYDDSNTKIGTATTSGQIYVDEVIETKGVVEYRKLACISCGKTIDDRVVIKTYKSSQ